MKMLTVNVEADLRIPIAMESLLLCMFLFFIRMKYLSICKNKKTMYKRDLAGPHRIAERRCSYAGHLRVRN